MLPGSRLCVDLIKAQNDLRDVGPPQAEMHRNCHLFRQVIIMIIIVHIGCLLDVSCFLVSSTAAYLTK